MYKIKFYLELKTGFSQLRYISGNVLLKVLNQLYYSFYEDDFYFMKKISKKCVPHEHSESPVEMRKTYSILNLKNNN